MKLITTKDYLLLIDVEAKIKEGDYFVNTIQKEVYHNNIKNYNVNKEYLKLIIAYRPLAKEAKELDLPLLPNPFEEKVDIEILALKNLNKRNKNFDNIGRPDLKSNLDYENGYLDGAKFGVAQSHSKQFSLEDVKKAIDLTQQICDRNAHYVQRDRNVHVPMITIDEEEEIIQSLSTQQLPKEFIPEFVQTKLYIKKRKFNDV